MKHFFSRFLISLGIVLFVVQPVSTAYAYGQSETASTSEQSLSLPVEVSKTQVVPVSKEYVLNNGLKVIFIKDKAFPFVSCFTWYEVGSRDDPPGMTGLTHLVEHLLFQNIGGYNGNQWANAVVRLGGEFSGFTSEDFTAFYSNLPTYQLELAIRGEAARMRSAHFTKADVTKEVERLVKEGKNRRTRSFAYAQ